MDTLNPTIQKLTEGLRELPTDDVARVKHFLAEYLGDTQHPVPFGGRARDFERLNQWLVEREGPACALLAAPAGRGKSALLLRWCQNLLTRSDLAIVYFPVSIRFRTNLAGIVFPALVALLGRLHDEKLPGDLHTREEVWHGLLREYLSRPLPDGRRLLVVLDGVDEAADWDAGDGLFPEQPAEHVRVVISARYLANDQDASGWLTRLGWTSPELAHSFELFPLDRAGIASVLIQMGFPLDLLGTRVDIVSELHRLSEGDPLLIRLYVDDLWQRGDAVTRLTPEDLQAIRPGLAGYFERWWNEQRSLWDQEAPQREVAAQELLNLLAGALGPLSKEDLLNLAPATSELRDENVEEHLRPLERFVIGDGMYQGYVFSHPRLASYFLEERLSQEERQEVERRFLNWGARTLAALNEGSLPPEQASPYIVQYYGAHLERAQADARDLCALVSDGWRRAWEKLDRGYAGFLGDCERAWRAAEHASASALAAGQGVPYLGAEIRSLLCRVSINSMTSNLSSRLMLEAVKTGVWTPAQGLASIRLLSELAPRARELVGLAPYVLEPLRTDILQEAFDTIASLKDERTRLDTLVELAPGFSEGLLEQTLEIVHTIDDEADRAGMLADLAPALALSTKLLEKALDILQEIEDEEYLVLALEGLTPHLHEEQQQHSLRLAQGIEDERYRAQAFTALVPHLPPSWLLEILATSRSMRAGIPHMRLLAALISVLPEAARDEVLTETLDQLSEVIDQAYRVEIFLKLAPFLPAEQLQQMLPEIRAIWDEGERAQALRELFPYFPAEQHVELLEAVLALKNEEQRVAVLLHLLPRLSASHHEAVLASIPAIWDEGLRVEILARLAPIIEAHLLPDLLAQVRACGDPGYRVWLLAEVEQTLVGQEHDLDITQTFLDMRRADERLQTLLAIVERVSDQALNRIFAIMEPEIFGFSGSLLQAERLVDIFSKFAHRMPAAWLSRTLQLVRTWGNEAYQVQVLIALAPRIDAQLLPIALDIVRTMRVREKRALVLEALVSSLPDESRAERVREMLQVLQIIKDEHARASLFERCTETLTDKFPATSIPDVLAAVAKLHSERCQAHVLIALADTSSPDQFEAILRAARGIRDEEERARVLETLAPRLPERSLPGFFATAQGLQKERWRTGVLTKLAEHITPAAFTGLLALALDQQNRQEQERVLGTLAAHLPEGAFPQFWNALQTLQNAGGHAWILSNLAAHLPEEYFAPFWQAIQDIDVQGWQLRIIKTLAEHTSEEHFPRLWEAIQQNNNQIWLSSVVRTIAPSIPESCYPQVFQLALTLPLPPQSRQQRQEKNFFSIPGQSGQETDGGILLRFASALEMLAEYVPESFFLQFWQIVCVMEESGQRSLLLQRLATRVPEASFIQIWNSINQVEKQPHEREHLYRRLARKIPERLFSQIWEVVEEMEDPERLGAWLDILAPQIPSDLLARFWQKTKKSGRAQEQLRRLLPLLPRLPREILAEVVEFVVQNSWYGKYRESLAMLLPQLSPEQSETFLTTLLPPQDDLNKALLELINSTASEWPYKWWKDILLALAPRLPEARLQAIFPALLNMALEQAHTDEDRALFLVKLAAHVPETALPAMLEAIWSIRMEHGRMQVLEILLPALTPTASQQVLNLALEKTRTSGEIAYVLQILKAAHNGLHHLEQQSLYSALRGILHTLAQYPRGEALAELTFLAPVLQILGGAETTVPVACSVLEIGCWWP